MESIPFFNEISISEHLWQILKIITLDFRKCQSKCCENLNESIVITHVSSSVVQWKCKCEMNFLCERMNSLLCFSIVVCRLLLWAAFFWHRGFFSSSQFTAVLGGYWAILIVTDNQNRKSLSFHQNWKLCDRFINCQQSTATTKS